MADCNPHQLIRIALKNCLTSISEKEDELGKLDAAAGDGDHGAGMTRGLRAANEALSNATDDGPAGMLLMQAGSTFSDAAGGASGALYGMFIMTIGKTLGAGPFETADIHEALDAGMAAIMKLGKSKPGDKTMLDALAPFIEALSQASGQALAKAWTAALPAAEAGAKSTADMVAAKGRSSKLGERSLGHPDPGATSMVYILNAVGKALDS
ncbi:MAG: dihydroxyacetone kinase subunit DhaL [Chloroflexota bacterium]